MKAEIVTDATGQPYGVLIHCPGCGDDHVLPTTAGHGAQWSWNGDLARPTFNPSLLVRSGHYARHHEPGDSCWCTYVPANGKPSPFSCYTCHSFIRGGRIQFLSDCTHALAGQTVDLPELESSP